MLLGGWAYTGSGRATQGEGSKKYVFNDYPNRDLFALNEKAFYDPDVDTMRRLTELGVTHMFADKRAGDVSPNLMDMCDVVHANASVTVCELRDS